jgi:hypothetical protein
MGMDVCLLSLLNVVERVAFVTGRSLVWGVLPGVCVCVCVSNFV